MFVLVKADLKEAATKAEVAIEFPLTEALPLWQSGCTASRRGGWASKPHD